MKKTLITVLTVFTALGSTASYADAQGKNIVVTETAAGSYVINAYTRLRLPVSINEPDLNGTSVYNVSLVSNDGKYSFYSMQKDNSWPVSNYVKALLHLYGKSNAQEVAFDTTDIPSGTYHIHVEQKSQDGKTTIASGDSKDSIKIYRLGECDFRGFARIDLGVNKYQSQPGEYYTSNNLERVSTDYTTKINQWNYSGNNDFGINWFAPVIQLPVTIPMYRMRDSKSRDFYYTTKLDEIASQSKLGYTSDGIVAYIFERKIPNTQALHRVTDTVSYRVYSAKLHRLILSDNNYSLNSLTDEGVLGYVYPVEDSIFNRSSQKVIDSTYRSSCVKNSTPDVDLQQIMRNLVVLNTKVLHNTGPFATVVAVGVTSTPSASLLVNGQSSGTFRVGDTVTWTWSSTNADTATSTYTNTCEPGVTRPWNKNTLSGTMVSPPFPNTQANCNYVLTYTAIQSRTGKTASSSINVNVLPATTLPTGGHGGGGTEITTPPPTASLAVNGQSSGTFYVGDTVTWTWNSTNADIATSTYTNTCDPEPGAVRAWNKSTSSGTMVSPPFPDLPVSKTRCDYVLTYKAIQSSTGKTAESSISVSVLLKVTGTVPVTNRSASISDVFGSFYNWIRSLVR